ncbi:unnamed protein product [Gongylonema pulchrum]|uniref:NUC domain-containing protein n=1 Tax=Gongylonema pulchrum TaxID=637853 RepID=A0A183DR07_9BILA|nr:unnamed protein product [Gongylonema pulchrum]
MVAVNRSEEWGVKNDHGYDFTLPAMRTIFYAFGPNIAKTTLGPFQNIELFNLMAGLLGLQHDIPPNNGTQGRLNKVLKDVTVKAPQRSGPMKACSAERLAKSGVTVWPRLSPSQRELLLDVKLTLSRLLQLHRISRRYKTFSTCLSSKDLACEKECAEVVSTRCCRITLFWKCGNVPPVKLLRCGKENQGVALIERIRPENPNPKDARLVWRPNQPTGATPDMKQERLKLQLPKQTIATQIIRQEQLKLQPPKQISVTQNIHQGQLNMHLPKLSIVSLSSKDDESLKVYLHSDFVKGHYMDLKNLVSDYAKFYGELLVMSGPVYDFDNNGVADPKQSRSNSVPSHIFFVIFRCEKSEWLRDTFQCKQPDALRALSFVLPNVKHDYNCLEPSVYLTTNLVRLRDVELLTGIEFLPTFRQSKSQVKEFYDDDFALTLRTWMPDKLWARNKDQTKLLVGNGSRVVSNHL